MNNSVKMDDVIISEVVGSPSLKYENDDEVFLCKMKKEVTTKMEIENEPEELCEIFVKVEEVKDVVSANDSPNGEDLLKLNTKVEIKQEACEGDPLKLCTKAEIKQEACEGDPLKLCTKAEIKQEACEKDPLKLYSKVEIKQEAYEEDPLKLCTKGEIKQVAFEFHSVGPPTSTGNINYNDDKGDSFQNEEIIKIEETPPPSPEMEEEGQEAAQEVENFEEILSRMVRETRHENQRGE